MTKKPARLRDVDSLNLLCLCCVCVGLGLLLGAVLLGGKSKTCSQKFVINAANETTTKEPVVPRSVDEQIAAVRFACGIFSWGSPCGDTGVFCTVQHTTNLLGEPIPVAPYFNDSMQVCCADGNITRCRETLLLSHAHCIEPDPTVGTYFTAYCQRLG